MGNIERKPLFSPYEWLETDNYFGQDCFHPTHRLVLLKRCHLQNSQTNTGEDTLFVYDSHGIEHEVSCHGVAKFDGAEYLVLGVSVEEWKIISSAQPDWDGFGY